MITRKVIKKFFIANVIICCPLFGVGTLHAQTEKKFPLINVQYHHGFLLNHSPLKSGKKGPVLKGIQGLEATFLWPTTGRQYWHKKYGYPKWGATFLFFNIGSGEIYGNPVHWGNAYSLLIHSSLRAIQTPFFELYMRLGTGLGYFSQVYHPVHNRENRWISSPINPSMHCQIETVYHLHPSWSFVLGGAFTHYSNGAIRMPNLGVNFPTLNVGVRYNALPAYKWRVLDTTIAPPPRHYAHISMGAGAKVLADTGTTYYTTLAASLQYGYYIGGFSKILVSLDAFRDNSLLDSTNKAANVDINRIGIWAGHEFLHGRVGLMFGWGYYIYKKTLRDANNYIKVGIRYHFHKNIFAAVVLKTHYGQADCFEWTMGYTLPSYK